MSIRRRPIRARVPVRAPARATIRASVQARVGRSLLTGAVTVGLLLVSASPAAAGGVCLRAPVSAPVADPFRPPSCAWCPGNRGIDYATGRATGVEAAAAGRVVFAGPVAGVVWLTVDHGRGLVSSYGPMAELAVTAGAVVRAGDTLGRSAGALHFGVRQDGRYVDPAPLIGTALHLVPRLIALDRRVPPPARCAAAPVSVVAPASASLVRRTGSLPELDTKRPILPAVARR